MTETCRHCGTHVFPNPDRTCPHCQGNLDGEPARQRIRDGAISRLCPNCGEAEHRTIKPDRWVAFVADRICAKCHTRYVPPTPMWAAVVFIVLGLLVTAGAGLDAVLHLKDAEMPLVLWKLLFLWVGLAVLVFGIRSLGHRRAAG